MILRILRRVDDFVETLLFDRLPSSRRGRIALALALIAGLTGVFVAWQSADENPAQSKTGLELLRERPWWDKYPNDPRATYHVYLFSKQRNLGAYVIVTAWRANYEFFLYKVLGNKVFYYFPESKTKGSTPVTIVNERGPHNFDLKLTLASDPKQESRPTKYYSWKRQRSGDVDRVIAQRLEKVLNELPEDFR